MVTTNKTDPVRIKPDNRRFFVIRSSDELIGDENKPYFTALHKLINDVNVVKTCYEYFINLKGLEHFMAIPVPVTEYQTDMQESAISPVRKWLYDFVCEKITEKDVAVKNLSKYFFDRFNNWCQEGKI